MSRFQITRLLILAAPWALSLGVIFATLCSQSLRPHLGDPQVERFGAYFVTAAAFVVAYPGRWRVVLLGIVAAAVVLELGQLMAPGRDAGVPDVVAKALGGVAGALLTHLGLALWNWRQARAAI